MNDSSELYPAKKLILNLVKEAEQPIPAHVLVKLAELFGIDANNVRVTLNRLVSQNFLELTDRGVYELGAQSKSLADKQGTWRQLEQALKPWDGSWLAIYVAHLGRRDRKQVRQRERATSLWGFRPFEQGLLVRPGNLRMELPLLQQRLYELGLDTEAVVFRAMDFQTKVKPEAMALWPVEELNQQYADLTQKMLLWLDNYPENSIEDAARESFLIGDQVLREIAYDPRLPQEMVDTEARKAMVDTMALFDDVGKAIWAELIRKFFSD